MPARLAVSDKITMLDAVEFPESEEPRRMLIKASEVIYEPPSWVIAPYIQAGKSNMIQGDPGSGKTALSCALIAHITSGDPLLGISIGKSGNVLVLSVEDDLPVLRGRIEANGGDLDKVFFMTNTAGITFNDPDVEGMIKKIFAVAVIFDPFQAFLGKYIDMSRANQTRPELAQLAEMADRNNCAVVILAHMGKDSRFNSVVNRSLGSVDIAGAMRSIIHLIRNPEDDDECVAIQVKCSNAPKGRSLAYTIADRGGIHWNGFSDITAESLQGILKRKKEKGLPYENEPLVQVFKQLIADKPSGGFWTYGDLKIVGSKILGFPPFETPADLKAKLENGLSKDLQEKDALIVSAGHRKRNQSGIYIERYVVPNNYQNSIDFDE